MYLTEENLFRLECDLESLWCVDKVFYYPTHIYIIPFKNKSVTYLPFVYNKKPITIGKE